MALGHNARGAVLMVAAMAAFTLNDAAMKAIGDGIPLVQAIFLRGIAATLGLAAYAIWHHDGLALPVRDRRLIALRTAMQIVGTYLLLSAVLNMPLANVTAILQTLPLSVTLAGALFLNEPVGWRRLTAIGVGFVGVLMIVQPGGEAFDRYSLYALGTVVCVTVRDLAARRLSGQVPSGSVAVIGATGVTLAFGLASIFTPWEAVRPHEAALLIAAAAFLVGAYLASVAAMRVGEIAVVTPFRYSALLVALVVGFLAFGEWPDAVALTGAAIVVAAGLFTLWRAERAAAQRPRAPADESA